MLGFLVERSRGHIHSERHQGEQTIRQSYGLWYLHNQVTALATHNRAWCRSLPMLAASHVGSRPVVQEKCCLAGVEAYKLPVSNQALYHSVLAQSRPSGLDARESGRP